MGRGKARMVDVGNKNPTARYARAACEVRMKPETFRAIKSQKIKKGDTFTVAQIAGILAAKKTSEFIPLCHPLSLEDIQIRFENLPGSPSAVRESFEILKPVLAHAVELLGEKVKDCSTRWPSSRALSS